MPSARQMELPLESSRPKKQSTWYDGLYREQRKAADFLLARLADRGGAALFSQQGTGKTHIALAVIEHLRPRLTLIVAPLTSLDVTWRDRLLTLPGTLARRPQELTEAFLPATLLIHPEYFTKAALQLAKISWDLVIIDESQLIKDRNSQRSRAARKLRNARRRLVLSGTPIDDSQIDVWAQMRFVDHTVLGENWSTFAEEYCYKSGYMGHEWKFRRDKHEQFLAALGNHIYRLSIDFMKLKPLNIIPVPVIMLGQQLKIYNDMDRHSVANINGHKIIAPLIITRDMKKAQITGGHIIDEEGQSFQVGQAKLRKLKWLLSQIDPPVVIFCQFLNEVEEIMRQLERAVMLTGEVVGETRTKIIKDFQAGKYNYIVCQLRTGGVSIELSRASSLVFYSFNYSYIDFEQVLSRVHRGGQTREVNAWLLYCIDSIDEEKIDVIKAKRSVAFNVLSHFEGVRNG